MLRFALLVLLVTTGTASAQPARTHDITPDDYFTLNAVTEIATSPNGKIVAYALATWDKAEDNRRTDLWVVATDGKGKPTKLTFDRANDRHPKWSSNGQHLYFLGNRKRAGETKPPYDGTTQVWRIGNDYGDPKPVTREPGGVTGFDYSFFPDETITYTKDKEHTDPDEFASLRAKHKAEYGHGVRKVSEVYRLDLLTWRTEKIIDPTRYIREMAVSTNGSVAMVTAADDSVLKSEGESRVDIWESGSLTTPSPDAYRKNAATPHAWLENLTWSTKGDLAFTVVFDGYPAEVCVMKYGSSESFTRVPRDGKWEVVGYGRAMGPSLGWKEHPNGVTTPMILTESKGRTRLNGTPANDAESTVGFSGDVRLASVTGQFPRLNLPTGHRDTCWLDQNPHTATWKLPSVQHVTWKAPDGTEVGGVLELPFGYKTGDKLPLVVAIHGGPTTSAKADLNFDPHNGRLYFAAKGYAVLCPNYRGSTGYGDKFVTDLIGNENDIEVKDILAGVQHLIKEGIADPDRVGVMGWSNGGYLTNCLIALKDSPVKFRAASSGAGILDTAAEWAFNDEPAYPLVFKKGHPWEQPDLYRKTSPLFSLGNVRTPTLIHVGGDDVRCPPGHSRALHRALHEYVKVPCELVVYPGEPHGLTKMSNRRAKMEWDLAWFDKYVMKKQNY